MATVKVNAFELRKLILDTNTPITDDLWKFLNDVDLEHTDRVIFITKDGKESEFVKTGDATVAKNETVGHWEMKPDPFGFFDEIPVCSECGCTTEMRKTYKFCPNCGARMDDEHLETDKE